MNTTRLFLAFLILAFGSSAAAREPFQVDTIKTSAGDLKITFIGHGTLMFVFDGKTIHVDPYSKLADYSTLPKADLILITHEHRDHLDPAALEAVRTEKTAVVLNEASSKDGQGWPGHEKRGCSNGQGDQD